MTDTKMRSHHAGAMEYARAHALPAGQHIHFNGLPYEQEMCKRNPCPFCIIAPHRTNPTYVPMDPIHALKEVWGTDMSLK